nr:hypothetical protein CFP56_05366 [Quercus suber]
MVSTLIDQDTKHWKAGLVKETFLPFEVDTILSIPLSYSLPDDNLICFWVGRPAILDGQAMDVIEVVLEVIRNGTQKDLETLFVTACPDGASSYIGVIIRDSSGHVTAAMSKPLPAHYPPKTVEVLALENGVMLSYEMNISRAIFESDSFATMQSVNAMVLGGPLGHILCGIRSSLLQFYSWNLYHLKWDHNRVTHEIAQLAKSVGFAQV